MNRELEFQAWHKDKMYPVVGLDWHPTCLTASLKRDDGVVFGEDNYYDGDTSFVLLEYTGHRSIDGIEVYDKYLLRFPGRNEIYEVRWDKQQGAWCITYNGMRYSEIGTVRFMQIAGNACANSELLEAD